MYQPSPETLAALGYLPRPEFIHDSLPRTFYGYEGKEGYGISVHHSGEVYFYDGNRVCFHGTLMRDEDLRAMLKEHEFPTTPAAQ